MLNRRRFFSALSGLPFIGAMFVPKLDEIRELKGELCRIRSLVAGHIILGTIRMSSQEILDKMFRLTNQNHDLRKKVAKLESQPRIEWISVKDRLPELDNKWQSWTSGDEPHELVTLGKMSLPVLVSSGHDLKCRSQFGHLVQGDGESPEWVVSDGAGMLWAAAATHWASLPMQFECDSALRKDAWKAFCGNRIHFARDNTPFDEKKWNYSLGVNPLKTIPLKGSRDVLFFGPDLKPCICSSKAPPVGATHWMYIPNVNHA